MATAATYKVYNGSEWVELTFTPSSHTHSEYATSTEVSTLRSDVSNLEQSLDTIYDEYATAESVSNAHVWKLLTRATISKNSGVSLASYNKYSELMIVVRLVTNAATTIGINNSATISSPSSCTAYLSIPSGTSYIKILRERTDEGYFAWTIISNLSNSSTFGWTNSSAYCYIANQNTAATSFTMSAVIHGR